MLGSCLVVGGSMAPVLARAWARDRHAAPYTAKSIGTHTGPGLGKETQYVYIYIYTYMCNIYIYIERERERAARCQYPFLCVFLLLCCVSFVVLCVSSLLFFDLCFYFLFSSKLLPSKPQRHRSPVQPGRSSLDSSREVGEHPREP